MRAAIVAVMLLLAAAPAGAQGKLWERSKQLTCSIAMMHACTEKACESKEAPVQFTIDLAGMRLCLIDAGQCADPEPIGTVKTLDRLLVVYSGQDKPDPSVIRIWDDGRFTALGLRELTGSDAGEGGFVMVGKCTVP